MIPRRGLKIPNKEETLPQEACEAILAQGPMGTTAADFWEMVRSSGSDTIFMVTDFQEGTTNKCYGYFPLESANQKEFDSCSVTTLSVEETDHYLIRKLQLQHKEETEESTHTNTKEITHIHVPNWQDHKVISVETIEKLLSHYPKNGNPPILHCSAGVGRSATLLACWRVKQEIDAKRASGQGGMVSITGIVQELREWRRGALRNYGQYQLIHTFATHYALKTKEN